jgi:hypothetical protein
VSVGIDLAARSATVETLDDVQVHRLRTAADAVQVTLVRHSDGAISVVAWSPAVGRRVGHLHRATPVTMPTLSLDLAGAGEPVAALMWALLREAHPPRVAAPA